MNALINYSIKNQALEDMYDLLEEFERAFPGQVAS